MRDYRKQTGNFGKKDGASHQCVLTDRRQLLTPRKRHRERERGGGERERERERERDRQTDRERDRERENDNDNDFNVVSQYTAV